MTRPGALTVQSAPATEPVTLTELKAHLRVDHTTDDDYITELGKAARKAYERQANRALVTQTLEWTIGCFPYGDTIRLPRPPLVSVTTVTYYNTANVSAVFSSGDYFVDTASEPGRIVLAYNDSWPSTTLRPANGVVIRFVAGFGAASAVPETCKAWIKLYAAHLYENREPVAVATISTMIPETLEALLWTDRVLEFA